jgi:hypothetical protein
MLEDPLLEWGLGSPVARSCTEPLIYGWQVGGML